MGMSYEDLERSLAKAGAEIVRLRALAAQQDGVREAAQFLIDRLDEFDPGDDEPEREYHGHVAPAIARLRSALEQHVSTTQEES